MRRFTKVCCAVSILGLILLNGQPLASQLMAPAGAACFDRGGFPKVGGSRTCFTEEWMCSWESTPNGMKTVCVDL